MPFALLLSLDGSNRNIFLELETKPLASRCFEVSSCGLRFHNHGCILTRQKEEYAMSDPSRPGAGKLRPATELGTARESLQQIQKKSANFCQSQVTRNTITIKLFVLSYECVCFHQPCCLYFALSSSAPSDFNRCGPLTLHGSLMWPSP